MEGGYIVKPAVCDISMIRGDHAHYLVSYKKDGAFVPFMPGDTVYFTVKENANKEEKVFQKVITNFVDGKAHIVIEPTDTKLLKPRAFVYDIQLVDVRSIVTTIVHPTSKFIIEGEVTYE